ncbi:hypothetical protein BDM02DRAFT_3132972 [Thelephora ganbajun]|uniref:Uncharacterized protein n=1 Tax=Thelephora ganbajun TaxID=370292 RepID=A0ACB6YZ78_THEGA|nr:hypothetical protein BDM02DRAFT_3132972 [Thelephora ganbajun]
MRGALPQRRVATSAESTSRRFVPGLPINAYRTDWLEEQLDTTNVVHPALVAKYTHDPQLAHHSNVYLVISAIQPRRFDSIADGRKYWPGPPADFLLFSLSDFTYYGPLMLALVRNLLLFGQAGFVPGVTGIPRTKQDLEGPAVLAGLGGNSLPLPSGHCNLEYDLKANSPALQTRLDAISFKHGDFYVDEPIDSTLAGTVSTRFSTYRSPVPPEGGRMVDGLDDKSGLVHRIALVNLLPLIGVVKNEKAGRNLITHSLFGNHGLYSESKISSKTLLNYWSAEGWGGYLCLTGATIGQFGPPGAQAIQCQNVLCKSDIMKKGDSHRAIARDNAASLRIIDGTEAKFGFPTLPLAESSRGLIDLDKVIANAGLARVESTSGQPVDKDVEGMFEKDILNRNYDTDAIPRKSSTTKSVPTTIWNPWEPLKSMPRNLGTSTASGTTFGGAKM